MSNKIIGIYCIENIKNQKKYIGQSIDINKRIKDHTRLLNSGKDNCRYLQRAWNEYGEDSFIFYIVKECLPEDLGEMEKAYILLFESHATMGGYNLSWGGEKTNMGLKATEETRAKLSSSLKGIKRSDETRKRMSIAQMGNKKNLGKKDSPETLIKKSMNQRGSKNPLSKLTEDIIPLIRIDLQSKLSMSKIGKKYGVSAATICNIKSGKSWRHV